MRHTTVIGVYAKCSPFHDGRERSKHWPAEPLARGARELIVCAALQPHHMWWRWCCAVVRIRPQSLDRGLPRRKSLPPPALAGFTCLEAGAIPACRFPCRALCNLCASTSNAVLRFAWSVLVRAKGVCPVRADFEGPRVFTALRKFADFREHGCSAWALAEPTDRGSTQRGMGTSPACPFCDNSPEDGAHPLALHSLVHSARDTKVCVCVCDAQEIQSKLKLRGSTCLYMSVCVCV